MNDAKIWLYGGVAVAILIVVSNGSGGMLMALTAIALAISMYVLRPQLKRRKRLDKLNTDLDPEVFILGTEAELRTLWKPEAKRRALLNIDLAVGHMAAGNNDAALDSLDKVNQKKLSYKNNTVMMYKVNRLLCLYRAGKLDQAEEMFRAELKEKEFSGGYIKQGVDRVKLERFFFQKRYQDFKLGLEEMIEEGPALTLRTELDLKYRVAQVAEIKGDLQKARQLYSEIAELGNELWVAIESREKIEALGPFEIQDGEEGQEQIEGESEA